MKTTRHLRLRLRLIEAALVLLLGALTTAAIGTHQLLLDVSNSPVNDVSFTGSHWVGTLDPWHLPGNVVMVDANNNVLVPGILNAAGGIVVGVNSGFIDTSSFGGNLVTDNAGGSLDTSNGGGYVATNGYGAPTDNYAPLGSLYLDQDPNGSSGHVLWVMGPGGWVGK